MLLRSNVLPRRNPFVRVQINWLHALVRKAIKFYERHYQIAGKSLSDSTKEYNKIYSGREQNSGKVKIYKDKKDNPHPKLVIFI